MKKFIVLFILLAIIYSDYCKTKEYNNANKIKATIMNKAGIRECANYGKGQANTKYIAYEVEYYVDGIRNDGTHLEKKDDYNVGDIVEIRYIYDKKNGYQIVNRDIKDRFYRLVLSACLAIPLIVIAIVLKRTGRI